MLSVTNDPYMMEMILADVQRLFLLDPANPMRGYQERIEYADLSRADQARVREIVKQLWTIIKVEGPHEKAPALVGQPRLEEAP